jgi:hypothetical protein
VTHLPEPSYVLYRRRTSFGAMLVIIFVVFAAGWGLVTLVKWIARWL